MIEDDSCLELRSSVYKCVVLWELDALVVVDVIMELKVGKTGILAIAVIGLRTSEYKCSVL